jgi:hypothetical protein
MTPPVPVVFLSRAVLGRGRWIREATPRPNWHQVSTAINGLDGRTKTVVRLETADPFVTLEVMRATESRSHYLVTHQREAGGGVVLASLDSIEPPATYSFRWAERAYEWPARCAVSKQLALRAARVFLETGGPDPDLCWEAVTHEVFADKRAIPKAP